MISLPKWAQPPVRYQTCTVRRPGADTSGAAPSSEEVTGKAGRGALKAYGFGLPPRSESPRGAFAALLALVTGITLTFLAIPIVALFTEVPLRDVPGLLREPAVRDALAVTLRTNLIANALILGFGRPRRGSRPAAVPRALARRHADRAAARSCRRRSPGSACSRPSGAGACSAPRCARRASRCRFSRGGRRPGHHLRGLAVLHPPGDQRVRVDRPELTDAARTLGATGGRLADRAAAGGRGCWPAGVLAFARGIGGSSAPPSSSPATCAGRRRR